MAGERITMFDFSFNGRGWIKVACLTTALSALISGSANADSIPLLNHQFDNPVVMPQGTSQIDFVLPFIDDWDEFGVAGDFGPFTGVLLDSGVFVNPFATTLEDAQKAYLRFNIAAGQNGEDITAISQKTAPEYVYEAEKDYTFTMAVAKSLNLEPGTDDQLNNPSTVVLWLGYDDGGTFQDVASFAIDALNLNGDGSLSDFSVTALGGDLPGAALGERIVVRVSQEGGITGAFDIDNARLSAVPEPGSAVLLTLATGLCLRRRRSNASGL